MIKLMDRILPMRLEGRKKAGVKRLAFMCSVKRKAKNYNLMFSCKLNRVWFKVGTMTIKQEEGTGRRNGTFGKK